MKKSVVSIILILLCYSVFAGSKVVKSDETGKAQFDSKDISIVVLLVNDFEATLQNWNSTPTNEYPIIASTSKASLKNDTVVPFIVYKVNKLKTFPVYYDLELIEPDGTKARDSGYKLIFSEKKPPVPNALFPVAQNAGWKLDKTDDEGKYKIAIKVYTNKKVLAEFEMPFEFTK